MRSLFELEEIEEYKSKLLIDLLSRFHPFTNEEIRAYRKFINFDRFHLMCNEHINWDK